MSSPKNARWPSKSDPTPGTPGPIFIGGLDRTGKTTMRAFLASHPNISIPAVGSNMETYFYGRFGDLGRPANLDRCLDAMLRYSHVKILEPDPDRIRREFPAGPPTYERLFSLFLIHYAEREGKPRWGAQTGLIERYADQLFEAHPGARVIHMVRDPRDRYEASLARFPNGRGRAGGATARWLYSLRLADRNLRRFPDSYLVVRFEDMVADTETTIRTACRFLNERYLPEMLSMPGAPDRRQRLTEGRETQPEQQILSDEFIGRFRGRIPPHELAFIQLRAGRKMRAYGYSVERLGLSASEWVRFASIDLPSQLARMLTWRGMEELHQRLPGRFGRKLDPRTIDREPMGASG